MKGGARPNSGPKKGTKQSLRITDYFSIKEIEEAVELAKKQMRKDPQMLRFILEQLFGKPKQPLVGGDGGALVVKVISYGNNDPFQLVSRDSSTTNSTEA